VREARGLLILLLVVVVLAGVVWFATRKPPESGVPSSDDEGPIRFSFTEASMVSPDLEVTLDAVKGAIFADSTSWLVYVVCAEAEGCVGEFALEVKYRGSDGSHRLVMVQQFDAANGEVLSFEGIRKPSTDVGKIDRVTLDVRHQGPPSEAETGVED
jgi:hypothetical protein